MAKGAQRKYTAVDAPSSASVAVPACGGARLKRAVAASNLAWTTFCLGAFVAAFAAGELRALHQLVPGAGGPWLRFAHMSFCVWSLFSFSELIPICAAMDGGTRLGAGFHTVHHVLRAVALWTLARAEYCSVQAELSCAAFCVHQCGMKLTYDLALLPRHVLWQNCLYLLYGSLAPHRSVCYLWGYLHGPLGLAIVPLLAMEAIVCFGFLTGYPAFVREQLLPFLRGRRPGLPVARAPAPPADIEAVAIVAAAEHGGSSVASAAALEYEGSSSSDDGAAASAAASALTLLFGTALEQPTGGTIYQHQLCDALAQSGAEPGGAGAGGAGAGARPSVERVEANSVDKAEAAVRAWRDAAPAEGAERRHLLVDGMAALLAHRALLPAVEPRAAAPTAERVAPSSPFALVVHWPFSAPEYAAEPWLAEVPPPPPSLRVPGSAQERALQIRALECALLRRASAVVCNSPTCARAVTALLESDPRAAGAGAAAERVQPPIVVVSPLLLLRPPPVRPLPPWALAPSALARPRALSLVTVGSVSPRKRTALVLKCAAAAARERGRPFRVHVVGDCGAHAAYAQGVRTLARQLCHELGAAGGAGGGSAASDPLLSVTFHGRLADEQLCHLLAHADCALSLSAHEGYGMAPIEAALGGVRVLGTRVGHLADALDGAPGCALLPAAECEEQATLALVELASEADDGAGAAAAMRAWALARRTPGGEVANPRRAAALVWAVLNRQTSEASARISAAL